MKKGLSVLLSIIMAFGVLASVNFSAFAAQSVAVKFEQSEARTVLGKINSLRSGSDAWYWNSDNKTKTYVNNAQPLTYDYTLEKIAMQRACELVYLYNHQRPNGSSVFTAYDQYGYASLGKGENIANGYPELNADAVHTAWREDNDYYEGQGHRRAMLDSRFTAVGIAHIYYYDTSLGCNVHFWAEEFGTTVHDISYTAPNNGNATVTLNDDRSVSVSNLVPTTTVVSTTIAPTATTTTLATASKPKSTSIKSLKKGKKSVTVNWKKVSYVKGYQVQLATDKKFKKNKKTVTVSKQKTTKTTVKKLKAKKKYYVRVRTYKVVNGTKIYSNWSKVKTVKTK